MKRVLQLIRVEWLVAVFCAWHAAVPLLQAWRHSHFDRLGWLAMLIWLIPAARRLWAGVDTSRHFKLAVASLAVSFIGVIGDLNVLIYIGLAGILGALASVTGKGWLWLLLAVCWLPAFGFVLARLHFTTLLVEILRVATAAAAAGLGLCWLPAPPKNPVPNL